MSDVLGTAWIEVRAKMDRLGRDLATGVTNQVGTAATKAAQQVARSAQTADAALKNNAANIKTIDTVSQAAAAAQTRLANAQATAAATAEKYGKNSAQARAATLAQSAAQRELDKALVTSTDHTNKMATAAQRGGKAAGAMFGVIIQNSQGALGPIGEVYAKLQGVGSALEGGRSKAAKWAVGLGAAATGVGTVLGTIASKEQTAERQLESAITNTGHNYDDFRKQIQSNIKMGERYGNTAAVTMSVLNRLTLATHNPAEAMKAYTATLNLAAARHIPVERAALLMGRAMNGNTMGLRMFGIQVESTTKLQQAQTTATKAHQAAMATLAKAQEHLRDVEARLGAAHQVGGTSALKSAQAHLTLQSAQNAAAKALDRYGPSSTQAQMAQERLSVAQMKYTAALSGSGKATGLTVSQQITLRHAQEALKAAQDKVTSSAQQQAKAHAAIAKAGDQATQVIQQTNKYLGGQGAATTDTFTGHLHAMAARIDDVAAGFGQKVYPALVSAGPALMGVGAIMETGVIGKFAKGAKNLATFSKESRIVTAATKVWTGVQAAFNLVMDANPIMLVAIAITALVAGIVIAYKKSATFRDIVKAAFRDIAAAGQWMWNSVLKPTFDAFVTAFHAVASAVTWAWDNVFRPYFKFIADLWMTVVGTIVDGAASAFGWVPGLGGKLKSAAKAFDGFKDDVNNALSGINDKKVSVDVALANKVQHPGGSGGPGAKLADGGVVRGPGGPRSDAVPIMASNGEFVVNAAATAQHLPVLQAINARRYADGGLVVGSNMPNVGAWKKGPLSHSYGQLVAGVAQALMGGAGAGGGAITGGLVGNIPSGARQRLIEQALQLAGAAVSAVNEAAVNLIVSHESGWNAKAINLWDINAKNGDPSRGLMQTIGSTFEAFRKKSLPDDIFNPLANLVAGINYADSRYGSLSNVPGVKAVARGGAYVGYASGGLLPAGKIVGINTRTGQKIVLNENGQEYVIPASLMPTLAQMTQAVQAPAQGSIGALYNSYSGAASALTSAQAAMRSPAVRAYSAEQAAMTRDQSRMTGYQAAIAHIKAGHQHTYIKNQEIAAIKAHETALRADEAAIKKHESTNKKAYDTATKNLAAAQKAADAAKQAMQTSMLSSITGMVQSTVTSATQGTGLTDIFAYQAGYGAGGAAGAVQMLQARITQMKAFGTALKALARKGLSPDFLQQLIAAGPQAGMAIATQLLGDPSAIVTIQNLTAQLNSVATGIGQGVAGLAYGIGGTVVPSASAIGKVSNHQYSQVNRPGSKAHPTASESGQRPLMVVHGDLVVRNEADMNKLQHTLYTAAANQNRATGTTR